MKHPVKYLVQRRRGDQWVPWYGEQLFIDYNRAQTLERRLLDRGYDSDDIRVAAVVEENRTCPPNSSRGCRRRAVDNPP
jgi:hypothetical protein